MNSGEGADPVEANFRPAPEASLRPSVTASAAASVAPLPLRLSVAKGVLGIELSEPIRVGPVVVDELDAELLELSFPVDLSKGVKQFRNRRTRLRRLSFSLSAPELCAKVQAHVDGLAQESATRVQLFPLFSSMRAATASSQIASGATAGVSLAGAASSEVQSQSVKDAGTPSLVGESEQADNDGGEAIGFALTIADEHSCQAFELLLESGNRPRLLLDNPRGLSHPDKEPMPPLAAGLQLIDQLLVPITSAWPEVARSGRSIEFGNFAQAICLELLPQLGCKLPEFPKLQVVQFGFRDGKLCVTLDQAGDPVVSGREALLLSNYVDLCKQADDCLAEGRLEAARTHYLELLEQSPAHPRLLCELAEIDLCLERPLAAQSLLEEALNQENFGAERARPRLVLASYRAQRALKKNDLARQLAEAILKREYSGQLRSQLLLQLVELAPADVDFQEVNPVLREAIALCPRAIRPRKLFLNWALRQNDLRNFTTEAAQLLALSSPSERPSVYLFLADSLLAAGHRARAAHYLKELRRFEPLPFPQNFSLASGLIAAGIHDAALETLNFSLRQPLDLASLSFEEETILSQGRLSLALLLAQADESEALLQVRGIESRGPVGLEARKLEIQLEKKRRRAGARGVGKALVAQAQLRLLEAVEMQWISLEDAANDLEKMAKERGVDAAVAQKLNELLG